MNAKSLGLILVLLAVTLPISSWFPVVKISTHPDNIVRDDYYPQIAVDPAGISYITWYGFDGKDYEIYWVRIDASGTPGTVKKISTHPDNTTRYDGIPQIAVDLSGNSYVVWEGWSASNSDIYWVKIPASGTPGTVTKISTHPDNRGRADSLTQIGVDSSGNSYVTWQGYDGHDNEIYWVKVDASGVPGTVTKISTHPDNRGRADWFPQIAVDLSGNSYVTWQGHDGTDYDIYSVKIDASGTPGTVTKISTHPDNRTGYDYTPQIAVDSSGNSYVVWKGYDGHDNEIYWVKVDASGVPGTVKKISTHPDNVSRHDISPQIGVDSSGNSYVTWYSGKVYWVEVDTSGVPGAVISISAPHHVSRFTLSPQIAVTPSGDSYITWRSYDGHDLDIYWISIVSGTPGPVVKVSTHPDNLTRHDYFSQIAVHPSGTSYVVWHGYDGHDTDIYFVLNEADSAGPLTTTIQVTPNPTDCALLAALTATIDDSKTGTSIIHTAEYFIDTVTANGTGVSMIAVDGALDSPTEVVTALIEVTGLSAGVHTIFVHGQDVLGNWGALLSISFNVRCLGATESLPPPEKMNEQMRPLAQYNITRAEELSVQVQEALSRAEAEGMNTLSCEEIIKEAQELLTMAEQYFIGGNYIAANIYALKAIEAYKRAMECLIH